MKTKAALQPNKDLEFSITVTATVGDWEAMLRQFEKLNEKSSWFAWPISTFVSQINEVMDRLNKTYHTAKADPPASEVVLQEGK